MPAWTRTVEKWFQDYVVTDWKYKLVALAAAVVIWAYVAGQQSIQVTYTVPLRFQNMPANLRLLDTKVSTAEVTLAGRRDRILNLNRRQIAVSLDLSGLRMGRNLYLISSRDVIVPPGLEVRDITPRQLSLQLGPEGPVLP
jgi:YbbR domain-containing protein